MWHCSKEATHTVLLHLDKLQGQAQLIYDEEAGTVSTLGAGARRKHRGGLTGLVILFLDAF